MVQITAWWAVVLIVVGVIVMNDAPLIGTALSDLILQGQQQPLKPEDPSKNAGGI